MLRSVAVVFFILAAAPAVQAAMAAPPPLAQRIAVGDVIVVGKVRLLEEKPVEVKEGATARSYRVGVVEIERKLKGAAGLTRVRVGFIPPPPPQPIDPTQPRIGGSGFRGPVLTPAQDGLFFLSKLPGSELYQLDGYFAFTPKASPEFKKQLGTIETATKLLADPKTGLAAKDAETRLLTATLLVYGYRRLPVGSDFRTAEQKPIDAAQSKAILRTLASAEWDKVDHNPFEGGPIQVFAMLGLTDKDGFKPTGDYKVAAKAWLKDNADTFRIKRFVVANEK